MISNKPRAENIQFLLVGIMLILGGLQNQNFPVIGNLLLLTGILLLVYSIYNLLCGRTHKFLKFFALSGELIGLVTASFILYKNGSEYLHILYLVASLGIFIAIMVHFFNNRRKRNLVE